MGRVIWGLFVLSFVFLPGIVAAQTPVAAPADSNNPKDNAPASYTLLEPLPCIPAEGVTCPTSADGTVATQDKIVFSNYIQYLFNLIIAISAVAAVLVLVWGGFKYVTTDSFGGKQEGRQVIQQALRGLLLVLCSYLILRTIDPRLVAIPSTIVAPLNITKDMRSSTFGFFEQLSTEASKYSANDRAAVLAREVAKRKTDELKSQLNEIDKKLSAIFSGDSNAAQEEINKLSIQRALIADQLNGTISEVSIQNAIAIYNAATRNIVDPVTPITLSAVNSALDSIEKVNQSTQKRLATNMNDQTPEQKIKQDNEKYFAQARILIVKYDQFSSSLDPKLVDNSIKELSALKVNIISKITDEAKRSELNQLADRAITHLNLLISTDQTDFGGSSY